MTWVFGFTLTSVGEKKSSATLTVGPFFGFPPLPACVAGAPATATAATAPRAIAVRLPLPARLTGTSDRE